MAKGDLQQSPFVQTFGDYLYDGASQIDPPHAVTIAVNFDNVTRVISNMVVWRASDCRWTKIVVGLGVDGTPDQSVRVFNLSTLNDHSRTINPNAFNGSPWNVVTFEDFVAAGQITASL